MQKFISKSELQTRKFAEKIAVDILQLKNLKQAVVLGLVGDLGAGKTTFAQSLARALGVRWRVLSPTFLIIKTYRLKVSAEGGFSKGGKGESLPAGRHGLKLVHIDAYRLNNPQELLDLGWEKKMADAGNIVVVEWADKIKDLMLKNAMWIHFEHGENEKTRNLQVLG